MTVIGLLCDEVTNMRVRDYLDEQNIPSSMVQFHSTLIYTEEHPIFQRQNTQRLLANSLPLIISGDYSLDIFGKDNLVLRHSDPRVEDLRERIIAEAVRQSLVEWPDLEGEELKTLRNVPMKRKSPIYPEFNPHITLAKSFDGDCKSFSLFQGNLTFSEFEWYEQ